MPALRFYITNEEKKELFDFVAVNNGIFVPEILYDKPELVQVQTSEELVERINIKEQTSYFIVSPIFQMEPLVLQQFEEKYERCKGKYYIMQRRGVPYISISFNIGFTSNLFILSFVVFSKIICTFAM